MELKEEGRKQIADSIIMTIYNLRTYGNFEFHGIAKKCKDALVQIEDKDILAFDLATVKKKHWNLDVASALANFYDKIDEHDPAYACVFLYTLMQDENLKQIHAQLRLETFGNTR